MNGQRFHLKSDGDKFIIAPSDNSFSILYKDNDFNSINIGPHKYDFSDLSETMFTSEQFKRFSVAVGLIEMFAKTGLNTSKRSLSDQFLDDNPDFGGEPQKRQVVGYGLGFHTDRSSAELACGSDHAQILSSNQGWYSGGVSISCAFGSNHLCVCSATYYIN